MIACEYSATVREAFAAAGCDAWSCDILPSKIPGKHLQCDVRDILYDGWDAMIAFPPCTFITVTANRSFVNNPERWEQRLEAMKFVYDLLNAPIEFIALENPVGAISTWIRQPDQYIQPFFFGHPVSKKTGLWLKGLPLLKPTKIVEPEWITDKTAGKRYSPIHYKTSSTNRPEVALLRGKTFEGVAAAMAGQWAPLLFLNVVSPTPPALHR
ncbi:MAG: DNA cytosine methyltransferase [Ignavibacteriales bacterium]|nr:DNA cytosine methyltransferase [Ignavibacteriales bacterium]